MQNKKSISEIILFLFSEKFNIFILFLMISLLQKINSLNREIITNCGRVNKMLIVILIT